MSGILTTCTARFKPDRSIVTMFVTIQQRNRRPAVPTAHDVVAVEHRARLMAGHRHGHAFRHSQEVLPALRGREVRVHRGRGNPRLNLTCKARTLGGQALKRPAADHEDPFAEPRRARYETQPWGEDPAGPGNTGP